MSHDDAARHYRHFSFLGLIVESLKTMRNCIGVLDGTLQLLKATTLCHLSRYSFVQHVIVFCLRSLPSCFLRRLIRCRRVSCPTHRLRCQVCVAFNFITVQQFN